MYLREMGAVELLSREGEIAIAKRIEAGRDTMIWGLCESPITFNAIIEWSNALNEGTMQLREILDLEAMLSKGPTPEQIAEGEEGDGDDEISEKTAGPTFKEEEEPEEEDAAPRTRRTTDRAPHPRAGRGRGRGQHPLASPRWKRRSSRRRSRSSPRSPRSTRNSPSSSRRASTRSAPASDFPPADEKKYQKLREQLTAEVESVQFHAAKIEYLVDQLYSYNRRLTALGGQMLRLAERHRCRARPSSTAIWAPSSTTAGSTARPRSTRSSPPSPPPRPTASSASAPRSPRSPRRPAWRSPSSAGSSTRSRRASARRASPRRKWSRPTCASSSRSPRNTPTAACSSSTSSRKAISA